MSVQLTNAEVKEILSVSGETQEQTKLMKSIYYCYVINARVNGSKTITVHLPYEEIRKHINASEFEVKRAIHRLQELGKFRAKDKGYFLPEFIS